MLPHPPDEITPPIAPVVHNVLSQIAKRKLSGLISVEEFDLKVKRLEQEELQPKGLLLIVRNLAEGGIRFLIKVAATGKTCDILDQGLFGEHSPLADLGEKVSRV